MPHCVQSCLSLGCHHHGRGARITDTAAARGGSQSCCCPFPFLGLVGIVMSPFSTDAAMLTGVWTQLPLQDRVPGILTAGPLILPFLAFQFTYLRCTDVWISHASYQCADQYSSHCRLKGADQGYVSLCHDADVTIRNSS